MKYLRSCIKMIDMDAWPILTRIWKLQRDLAQKATPCIDGFAISPRGLMLLAFVERYPNPSGLARELHIPTPSVSHALKKLEQSGLLERKNDPNDLRRFVFILTEKGKRALVGGQECLQSSFRETLKRLDPAERRELDRLLQKLTEGES